MGGYSLGSVRFGMNLPHKQLLLNNSYTQKDRPENLPGYQEYADYLFEKAYRDEVKFNLPKELKDELDEFIKLKAQVCPPKPEQLKEEMAEVVAESPLDSPINRISLINTLKVPLFDMVNHLEVLHYMRWPFKSPETFFRFALDKLKGRMDAQKEYPQLSYEGRKTMMKPFEENSARYWFNGK